MTQQQTQPHPKPNAKAKTNHAPTIFWIIVVVGLIITVGYFGFYDVPAPPKQP